jgi:2-polyprenyl-6-methoxyphenol hydroxylase-like FAD-dependent oxidoreductase
MALTNRIRPQWDYDIIIVGAGVAGSSSAISLGQEGYRVLLLDRAVFPRHKTCGEGIMPEGVRILDSLGLLPSMLDEGAGVVQGLRFRSQAGVWAQADFPPLVGEPAYSVVIRRYELDHLLIQHAKSLPTVTVREGFAMEEALCNGGTIQGVTGHQVDQPKRSETLRAPLTLGADGMRSRFHNRYGITRRVRRRQRWGISGHLKGVEGLRPYIEVLFQADHEIYLAPLSGDMALVAILLEKKAMAALRGNLAERYYQFLKSAPGLGQRVRDSEMVPPVGARGPLGFTVDPVYLPGLLLIGDSAGFLDPITGEGMTLALKSVQAAVPVVQQAFETGNFGPEILGQYAAERARVIKDVSQLTQLMLNVSRWSVLTDRAIRGLSSDEKLFQKLLGIVVGTNRYRDFALKDRLALALG